MIKSNGNGAYITKKWVMWLMGLLIAAMGSWILSDITRGTVRIEGILAGEIKDRQEAVSGEASQRVMMARANADSIVALKVRLTTLETDRQWERETLLDIKSGLTELSARFRQHELGK
jgi:hypothetical protein